MKITELATKFVELCRQGKIEEVQKTFFADNAQSIEANDSMGPKVVSGLNAIKAKTKAFDEALEEFHSATISNPIVAGNSFAITWVLDATFKGRGRMMVEEICVYQVKDGKIILEQFFY